MRLQYVPRTGRHSDEIGGTEAAEYADMNAMLEESVLWEQDGIAGDGNAGDGNAEALGATRSLITTSGHDVLLLKRYLEFVRALADKAQRVQRESDATTRHLSEPK